MLNKKVDEVYIINNNTFTIFKGFLSIDDYSFDDELLTDDFFFHKDELRHEV